MSRPDIDVACLACINLPSTFFLDPRDNMGFFPVVLRVASEAMYDDLVTNTNQTIRLVFTYGLDPVFLESPFLASWNNVILLGHLPKLPYFEFLNVIE